MEPPARRKNILRLLCRRGNMKMKDLAGEFGVTRRTIERDIGIISLTEPIYTKTGRYGGGVYIQEDYMPTDMYITYNEAKILKNLLNCAENGVACKLTPVEIALMSKLINDYSGGEE